MAGGFTDLDRAPIITDYDFVIKGFRLRKRDVVMGGLTFICLVVVIILTAILATKSGGHSGADESQKEACSTVGCLRSAAHIIELLNETASPCENFYKYACGNFADLHPLQYDQSGISTSSLIALENAEKILRVLGQEDKTTRSDSFERKLRVFYKSCKDHYRKAQRWGKPLLEKIINPSGGWWALQNSSEWIASNWNFKQALLKAYRDFMVDVFFTLGHSNSLLETFEIEIEVASAKLIHKTSSEEDKKSAKTFFKKVGSLLLSDAGVNLTDDEKELRAETFAQDIYYVKTNLIYSLDDNPIELNLSLENLTFITHGEVNWFEIISSVFDSVKWTNQSKVKVLDLSRLQLVATFIGNLDISNKSRILNNYFVWCFAYNFIDYFYWEDIVAEQQLTLEDRGSVGFLDTERYCLHFVKKKMDEAVGAIFVRQHFVDLNKNKSHEITGYVQSTLLERLGSPDHWMSGTTGIRAIKKLQTSRIKLGYPDYMMKDETMDSLYSSVTVSNDDYLGNILNLIKFRISERNKSMAVKDEDKSEWSHGVLLPYVDYVDYWVTLVISAGYLQFPLYDYTLPHCVNFGTLGAIVGKKLVHAIDYFGQEYDENGSYSPWWTNQTCSQYDDILECMKPFLKDFPYVNNAEILKESSGIQIAFRKKDSSYKTKNPKTYKSIGNAYKEWVKKNGAENIMTGDKLTSEQIFFVSYAQTNCYNHRPYDGSFPETDEVTMNVALAQVPEFQQAFNCPANSKMVTARRCKLY